MTKILLALLALAASALDASAQQIRIYDSAGRSIGSASTDSQGTTTTYDDRGRVVSRESTSSGGITTIYDARGRNVGRFTTNR